MLSSQYSIAQVIKLPQYCWDELNTGDQTVRRTAFSCVDSNKIEAHFLWCCSRALYQGIHIQTHERPVISVSKQFILKQIAFTFATQLTHALNDIHSIVNNFHNFSFSAFNEQSCKNSSISCSYGSDSSNENMIRI